MYHKWKFNNWTQREVQFKALPRKPSTGHATSIDVQGNEIWYVKGSVCWGGGVLPGTLSHYML